MVEIPVGMSDPCRARLHDLRCGPSGMFGQSPELLRAHAAGNGGGGTVPGGAGVDIAIRGRESNDPAWRPAKMNLAIHDTEVRSLPTSFSVSMPPLDGLDAVVADPAGLLTRERASETLTVHGLPGNGLYRSLLGCCGADERRAEIRPLPRDLREGSSLFIADDELRSFETHARRMRGEILFAERRLIVEGHADHLIEHAVAWTPDHDFDRHGVSVIDARNNGNPAIFAMPARALDVPWLAAFDDNGAGQKPRRAMANRGFSDEEPRQRCRARIADDLEAQVVADGIGPEPREVLAGLDVQGARALNEEDLVVHLRASKAAGAAELATRVRQDADLAQRAPEAFRAAIEQLRRLA